ncbi:MAG: DNA gyrase/topoisomerase IV subunit A [Christensenellales bacterium]|jgi:DNA gyrase subunit A
MARENKKKPSDIPPRGEVVFQRPMEEVMHECMMPYSEFVILERALPRVEDGLKPVQRRILYTMHELGLTPDKPHRKCARIVGDCLGKYHPHGDTSVYDALTRLAQPFVMRAPLVDGHGNFGSIDGDSPAAMRYTEARMTPQALELLRDIDKDTVDFQLNFDDTQKEPCLLPGRFPNLLVNGATGIAVGLATNIPPHNLAEVIDGTIAQIDNPNITTKELMKHIPAPDFPTGGILLEDEELFTAYETGRGKLQVRAKVDIEKGSAGRTLLVVTEVPYQVNKAAMLEKILRLSEDKKNLFSGIYDIRDESDRTGMRAVVELKKDANPQNVLNALYKYSDLQVTFGVNIVAIAGGKPVQMGIKTVLAHYIRHQKEVVTRRTQYELAQAKARAHILEGLIKAVDNLDEVIRIIRASKTPSDARTNLCERFGFTQIQSQAILDMRLQRLTNLEIVSLRKEYEELRKLIEKLEGILKSEKKLLQVIREELLETRKKYADARRTKIIPKPDGEIVIEEEKPVAEDVIVQITDGGFLRRLSSGRTPEEGGTIFRLTTDDRLFFVTDKGFCYPAQVSQIPECRPKDRGLALSGLLPGLENDEVLIAVWALPDGDGYAGEVLFVTEKGQVKRSKYADYEVRKNRFSGISLKDGDRLVSVSRMGEEKLLLLITRLGMAMQFDVSEVPTTGRMTSGVRGIALGANDAVLSAIPHDSEGEVLLVSDMGFMKRCLLVDFDPRGRGGKGVACFKFVKNAANGAKLVAALPVKEPFDFAVTLKRSGQTTLNTETIRIQQRGDKGVPVVPCVMDDLVERVDKVERG